MKSYTVSFLRSSGFLATLYIKINVQNNNLFFAAKKLREEKGKIVVKEGPKKGRKQKKGLRKHNF